MYCFKLKVKKVKIMKTLNFIPILFFFNLIICEDVDLKNFGGYLEPIKLKVNPQNTIFAFDLHEVLFYRDVKKIAWEAVKMMSSGMFWYALNPFCWQKFMNLYSQGLTSEAIFNQFLKEYPYMEKFRGNFLEVANACCYPIVPMIELLKKLKNKGFKLFLLSNIGEDCLKDFKNRFEIMKIFDGTYVPCRVNNYISKPSLEFYQGFKTHLNNLGYKNMQILFIDDLKKNLKPAYECGIACVHFVGYQNLNASLNKLEIT